MGVPLLLSWLRQYCGGCFTQAGSTEYSCDNLYVDLNSMMYNAVRFVMDANQEFLDAYKAKNSAKASQAPSPERFEVLVLEKLVKILDDIIFNIAKPKRLVYLAADGVSPKGKMARQRERRESNSRRFHNVVVKEVLGWDVNGVTSGTSFMLRASHVMEWYAASRTQKMAALRGEGEAPLSIIVSDGTSPGEGEYKIFEFMRSSRDSRLYDPNTTHCICSTDTDVVVCSLPLHEPHIDVLRVTDSHEPSAFFSIEKFRALLFKRMMSPSDNQVFERALHDIVFILLLFGNDFLPGLFDVDIGGGQLDRLIDFLASDFISRGRGLTEPDKNKFDVDRVVYFLRNVEDCTAKVEGFVTRNVGEKRKRAPGLSIDNGFEGATSWGFEESADAKKAAAERTAKNKRRGEDFAIGLQWALQYYCGRCPSWSWYYPHSDAPPTEDLCEALLQMGDTQHFAPSVSLPTEGDAREDEPEQEVTIDDLVPVFEQLVMLLPSTSKGLLPIAFQRSYDDFASLLSQTDFSRLPFDKIHQLCSELEGRMSSVEKERAGSRNGAPYGAFLGTFLHETSEKKKQQSLSASASPKELPSAVAQQPTTNVISFVGGDDDWGTDFAAGGLPDLTSLNETPEGAQDGIGELPDLLALGESNAGTAAVDTLALSPGTRASCREQTTFHLETQSYHLKVVDPPRRLLYGGFERCGDQACRSSFAGDLSRQPVVHVQEFHSLFSKHSLLYTPVDLLAGCKTSLAIDVAAGVAGGRGNAVTPPPALAVPPTPNTTTNDLQERLRKKKEALRQKLEEKQAKETKDQVAEMMKKVQ